MLVGVQDIHYNVQDMDRAVAFYRDTLGMRVMDTNAHWTSLDFFGARIGLRFNGGGLVPGVACDRDGALAGATVTLRSTDLEADVAFVTARGARLHARQDHEWGRVATLFDPDGNVFKLMQPPRKT